MTSLKCVLSPKSVTFHLPTWPVLKTARKLNPQCSGSFSIDLSLSQAQILLHRTFIILKKNGREKYRRKRRKRKQTTKDFIQCPQKQKIGPKEQSASQVHRVNLLLHQPLSEFVMTCPVDGIENEQMQVLWKLFGSAPMSVGQKGLNFRLILARLSPSPKNSSLLSGPRRSTITVENDLLAAFLFISMAVCSQHQSECTAASERLSMVNRLFARIKPYLDWWTRQLRRV